MLNEFNDDSLIVICIAEIIIRFTVTKAQYIRKGGSPLKDIVDLLDS